MHEVVTLQFGQQANYVGTHYWNTQESYFTYPGQEESPVNHDISFRAGIGPDGSDTYTPRTLIYDLKGAFGTLRRVSGLYELQRQGRPNQDGPWSGRTSSLQLPPIGQSAYQQALDQGTEPPTLTTDTVRFWSDYNHMFYHPRSSIQLNEYELNSSLMPFERWQTGEELFANLDREHDLLDRDLRPFLEECDQLQAIQVFSGIDDAWGGFSSRYLERISDDLGKGCRWVFGLNDGRQGTRERQMLQSANIAQSLYNLNAPASMMIPISSLPTTLPSYISIDASSPWHTSALQAAMVESITLPTRLRSSVSGHASFDQLESTLNNDGNRKLVAAAMSIDSPTHLEDILEASSTQVTRMTNGISDNAYDEDPKLDVDFFRVIRPLANTNGNRLGHRPHTFSKVETLRGSWSSNENDSSSDAYSRDPFTQGPRANTYSSQLLLPVLSSYPRIFNFTPPPQALAVRATLSTSTTVANDVRRLEATTRRLISIEEREALSDGLSTIAEEYEEGWSGSDGTDDDD